MEETFDKLNSSICLDKEFHYDLENITNLDESTMKWKIARHKNQGPFGIHFQNELVNCKGLIGIFEMEEQNENIPKNDYNIPDLSSFLVTYCMPICPL